MICWLLWRVLEGIGLVAGEVAFEELNSNENKADELNADGLNADELNADELTVEELELCFMLTAPLFYLLNFWFFNPLEIRRFPVSFNKENIDKYS